LVNDHQENKKNKRDLIFFNYRRKSAVEPAFPQKTMTDSGQNVRKKIYHLKTLEK
jgi:hypothetical protein